MLDRVVVVGGGALHHVGSERHLEVVGGHGRVALVGLEVGNLVDGVSGVTASSRSRVELAILSRKPGRRWSIVDRQAGVAVVELAWP